MKDCRYVYVKAPVLIVTETKPAPRSGIKRLLGPMLITIGSLMVTNVVWPIMSYQLLNAPDLQRTALIAPIPKEDLGNSINQAIPVAAVQPTVTQANAADLDLTKASNWFPNAPQVQAENPESYILSIPAVGVLNATVKIGSDDLNKSLVQYGGTALPGQLGSPVIFGHSILRQFYDPAEKNSRRYMSIFSKIMTLKNGDRIFIDYDGIRYTYEVKDKAEVSPDDLFILEQKYSDRELKLITCVPEGTSLRRGVVIADLVDLQQ